MHRNKQNLHPCSKATGILFFRARTQARVSLRSQYKIFIPIVLGVVSIIGILFTLQSQAALAQAGPDQAQIINAGLAYLKSQQQTDGGIVGFSGVADPDTTARSVLAYIAAGKPVSEAVSLAGNSMMDYLSAQAITFTHDTTGTLFPGRAGELLAAVSLVGESPQSFGGMDLLTALEASFHPDTGAYSTTAKQDFASGEASDLNQAWAILGLSLADQSIPQAASHYLIKSQAMDGSWGAGDPDTTALVMTALLSGGNVTAKDDAIQHALDYFHATQAPSGGWKPSWDNDPLNADSTGWVIQALVSAGEDVRGQSWTKNNINPVDALLGLQKPDGTIGGTYANTYSTAEAIIGLSGIPLSSLRVAPATHRAGLAVFSGGDNVFTKCISFTVDSMTGLGLLQESGLAIETATNPTQGTAICKIGDVGDDPSNCFGSMPDYWVYWDLGTNGWEYSPVGADRSQVVDGGAYAWSWGTGNPPPVLTFQNICEGVAYSLPAITATTSPPTTLPQSSSAATQTPGQASIQPTAPAVTGRSSTTSYAIYASILLVLGLVIIILFRSRKA